MAAINASREAARRAWSRKGVFLVMARVPPFIGRGTARRMPVGPGKSPRYYPQGPKGIRDIRLGIKVNGGMAPQFPGADESEAAGEESPR